MARFSRDASLDDADATILPPGYRCAAQNPAVSGDDRLLAALYMRMWALASGRPLPRDVPPGELTEEELLSFWADDFRQHTARHATTAGGGK